MKLGVNYGSGILYPEIVSFVQDNAGDGGWRGNFSTQLYEDAQEVGLEQALKTRPLTWTYEEQPDGTLAYGVTGWQLMQGCADAEIPMLLLLDPMNPGDLDGTGYHQSRQPGALAFPNTDYDALMSFAEELLALIRSEFPTLTLSGFQWGNEVEYVGDDWDQWAADYVPTWQEGYQLYYDCLSGLGELLPSYYPGVPVIVGGLWGDELNSLGNAQSLTWYCGEAAESEGWPDTNAPLALDFHATFLVGSKAEPSSDDVDEMIDNITTWSQNLQANFPGRLLFITECAGYEDFDRLGGAALTAGVDGFWAVACRWIQPTWGVFQQNDTEAMTMFGPAEWEPGPSTTRESFESLAGDVAEGG